MCGTSLVTKIHQKYFYIHNLQEIEIVVLNVTFV